MSTESLAAKELRPDKTGYFKYRLGVYILSTIFVCVCLIIGLGFANDFLAKKAGFSISVWFILVPAVLFAIYSFLVIQAKYSKTKYTLYKDRINFHGGSLFSDFENELNYKNVTRVSLILPYMENYFCKTGNVLIESAGATETEIVLSSVSDPKALYNGILNNLKENGFQLNMKKLIQVERPHPLAVFLQTGQSVLYALFIIAWILGSSDEKTGKSFILPWLLAHPPVALLLGVIILIGLTIYGILIYFELQRRVYRLFDDAIEYHEGFLTKVTSIIPMENLTDSTVKQGFISKMFGLYDVNLSCQGSNQAISFLNIANGELLSENLDRHIKLFSARTKEQVPEQTANELHTASSQAISGTAQPQTPASAKKLIDYDRTSTLELKMDALKSWIPIIVLVLFFIVSIVFLPRAAQIIAAFCSFIVVCVMSVFIIIRISKTIYKIKGSSVEKTFCFLSRSTTEFTFEKITAVTFKQSILDQIAKTHAIIFWSIGASQPLILQNVRITDSDKKMIMAKCGIHDKKKNEVHLIAADFSFASMICANLFSYSFLLTLLVVSGAVFPQFIIASLVIVLILFGLSFAFLNMYHKRSNLRFHDDHIQFTHGLVSLYHQCALYEDIKDISTVKFPMTNKGLLQFNIAGESLAPRGNKSLNKQPGAMFLNFAFKFKHADNIELLDELIDSILIMGLSSEASVKELIHKPSDHKYTDRVTARSSILNPLIKSGFYTIFALASILIVPQFTVFQFPFWANTIIISVLLLINVIVAIQTNARRYSIQDKRVLAKSGVIYKQQITVIFDRIDFINSQQGALNKLCRNGNVTVNTAGSSKPEIIVRDISNYREFYDELKRVYN